jgi:hypothetical protein
MESRFYIDEHYGCIFSHHGGDYRAGQFKEYIGHVINLPEYLIGMSFYAAIHPHDSDAVRAENWIESIGGGKFVCVDGLNGNFAQGLVRRGNVTDLTPLKDREAAFRYLGIDTDYALRFHDQPHYSQA